MHPIGWLFIPLAVAVSAVGLWLGKRYGAAIEYEGIGRPHSLRHSALAFLGNALVILGLVGLMIAIMVSFF